MYEELNSTLAGDNLGYFFTYANQVTNGYFALMTLVAFWLVVFLGSITMQMRFGQRLRPETSFLASCFVGLGYATILNQISGIFNAYYFLVLIGMTIIGIIWVARSPE